MHIYNWYHSDFTGIHYIHELLQWVIEQSSCFLLSLFSIPFCSPFVSPYLLGTLLAVIGSVRLVPRLLVNWSSHFPPIPLFQNPDPPEFLRSKYTFIRTTSLTWLTRSNYDLFVFVLNLLLWHYLWSRRVLWKCESAKQHSIVLGIETGFS